MDLKRTITVSALAAGLLLAAAACADTEGDSAEDDTASTQTQQQPSTLPPMPQGEAAAASIEDIHDNAAAYYGKPVTVTGDVAEVVAPNVMRLNEGGAGGDDLLAIIPGNAAAPPGGQWSVDEDLEAADVDVVVTGMVARFDRADIQRDYGMDLSDDALDDLEGDAVIIARSWQVGPDRN
jgi:hypothetical protein